MYPFLWCVLPLSVPDGFGEDVVSAIQVHDPILQVELPFVLTSVDLRREKRESSVGTDGCLALSHNAMRVCVCVSEENRETKWTVSVMALGEEQRGILDTYRKSGVSSLWILIYRIHTSYCSHLGMTYLVVLAHHHVLCVKQFLVLLVTHIIFTIQRLLRESERRLIMYLSLHSQFSVSPIFI